jgi:hypothetical protein
MPEEFTFLLNKSYFRESRTDFPGKRDWQNRRDTGKSGTVNPGNETLPVSDLFGLKLSLFCGVANDGAAIVIEWFSISSTFFSAFFNMVDA